MIGRESAARVDAAARRTAWALTRRASLLALGGAAAAAGAARPASTKAGDPGKASRKQAKRKCRAQGRQCRVAVANLCETNNLDCERVLPCCDLFARCQAPEGLRCIFADPPEEPEL